jgi:hypothetical protein
MGTRAASADSGVPLRDTDLCAFSSDTEVDLSEGNNFNVASNDIERDKAIPLLEGEAMANSEELRLVSPRSCNVMNEGYEVATGQRSDDNGERDNSVLEDAETVDDDTEQAFRSRRRGA